MIMVGCYQNEDEIKHARGRKCWFSVGQTFE